LIEIVGKGRDARAAARVADVCAFASVLEALIWVRPLGSVPLWGVKLQGGVGRDGGAWDKLESLILAQNERWRHA
jgi:hypothetical protein